MFWLILLIIAAAVAWRTCSWPFDRSYTVGGIKIPKYGENDPPK